MVNETFETETLEALAEKIARYATEADERTTEAAKLIREARKRIEAGDAGGHCHVNRTYCELAVTRRWSPYTFSRA